MHVNSVWERNSRSSEAVRLSSIRPPCPGGGDRPNRSAFQILFPGVLLGVALLAGCAKPAAPADAGKPWTAANAADKRYPLTGEIVSIDAARKVLVVRHDKVKDYMPAMTMEFIVAPGDLAIVRHGERIRAEMVPSKDGDFRLEKIWPDDQVAATTVAAGARALRQDTLIRGKGVYREVGEVLPDFALYDQTGRVVQSRRFRGKQIMLNFIFTRCPASTMCPASTTKMIGAQKLARDAGIPNIEFVSLTLDPAYDTPGVLRDYADRRGIETTNFSFLTGPDNAIKDLLAQFGVIAEFDGDLLKHSLATLLINAEGRIIHRADGSAWEPKDFVAKMRK
ncbi:MAG: redoxin domain-containing protein [Opitutaceae bacterium]|nr:redoxin domain-containing protein [Opitutaceae bacterium]